MGLVTEGLKHCVYASANAMTNNQENFGELNNKNVDYNLSVAILFFMLALMLFVAILFLGKLLWNNVAVKCVTVLKPVRSIVDILGLVVLSSLLFGC